MNIRDWILLAAGIVVVLAVILCWCLCASRSRDDNWREASDEEQMKAIRELNGRKNPGGKRPGRKTKK